MRISNTLVLASTNRHKLEEFQELLRPYPEVELVSASAVIFNADQLRRVEKYGSYLENALAKARHANHAAHFPSLADDSGLEVQALEGRPGARSARYATPRTGMMQDQANLQKILEELKGVPTEKRTARFVCVVALVIEGLHLDAQGILNGRISDAPRGAAGFGYDSIFIPEGHTRTLAEMSAEEKNRISHRAQSVERLMSQLKATGILFAKP